MHEFMRLRQRNPRLAAAFGLLSALALIGGLALLFLR